MSRKSYEGSSQVLPGGFRRNLYELVKSSTHISNMEKLAAETERITKFW